MVNRVKVTRMQGQLRPQARLRILGSGWGQSVASVDGYRKMYRVFAIVMRRIGFGRLLLAQSRRAQAGAAHGHRAVRIRPARAPRPGFPTAKPAARPARSPCPRTPPTTSPSRSTATSRARRRSKWPRSATTPCSCGRTRSWCNWRPRRRRRSPERAVRKRPAAKPKPKAAKQAAPPAPKPAAPPAAAAPAAAAACPSAAVALAARAALTPRFRRAFRRMPARNRALDRLVILRPDCLYKCLRGRENRRARTDNGPIRSRTRSSGHATTPADRSVRARHHLSARVGDRPLRFPLRLLHVGTHDVPAQGRPAQP